MSTYVAHAEPGNEENVMMFDPKAFGRELRALLRHYSISVREAAKIVKVSPATISRVARGREPSVESYLRIEDWIGWVQTGGNPRKYPK